MIAKNTSQPADSVALIAALNHGDERALRQLLNMYYEPICNFAYNLIGNMQEAEDIAGDIFIKIWNRRLDFNNLTSLKSFLYTSARNACLNVIRDKHRRTSREQEIKYRLEEDEDFVLNKIVNAELHNEIRLLLEKLPKKPGRVLKELYLNGKELSEVAEELDMLEQTVHTNKSRGIHNLRKWITAHDLLPVAVAIGSVITSIYIARLIFPTTLF